LNESQIGEGGEIVEENLQDQQSIMPHKVTMMTKEDDQRLAFHRAQIGKSSNQDSDQDKPYQYYLSKNGGA